MAKEFIRLERAEAHIKGTTIIVNVRQIDTYSPNVLNGAETLMRVNGKEFLVLESVEAIIEKIHGPRST